MDLTGYLYKVNKYKHKYLSARNSKYISFIEKRLKCANMQAFWYFHISTYILARVIRQKSVNRYKKKIFCINEL